MKILICPDKFKSSLNSEELCAAIHEGIKLSKGEHEVIECPMADGGEGSLSILEKQLDCQRISGKYSDCYGEKIQAFYLLQGDDAYIEMAQTCGLALYSDAERNILKASTTGVGEQITEAINKGAKRIYLFLGGSATNDLGLGMAESLGFKFFTKKGYRKVLSANTLDKIYSIREPKNIDQINQTEFIVLSDVENPLLGRAGCTHTFAKQKGASQNEILAMDNSLEQFSQRFMTGDKSQIVHASGAGAAGGLGAGAMYFLNARLESGARFISKAVKLEENVKNADLIITGEGKLDQQSLDGKLLKHLLGLVTKTPGKIWIVCGTSELSASQIRASTNLKILVSSSLSRDLYDSLHNASTYVKEIVYRQCIMERI